MGKTSIINSAQSNALITPNNSTVTKAMQETPTTSIWLKW